MKAYLGIDPTADSIHLGNLIGLNLLFQLYKFGSEVSILVKFSCNNS